MIPKNLHYFVFFEKSIIWNYDLSIHFDMDKRDSILNSLDKKKKILNCFSHNTLHQSYIFLTETVSYLSSMIQCFFLFPLKIETRTLGR